jgi:hypothetical protein
MGTARRHFWVVAKGASVTQSIFKPAMLRQCLVAIVVLQMCTVLGCHRGYYRRQADAEARRLIAEKSCDPRWNSADGSLAIVPESRMFNPFSSDHAPLPPDDPESHKLMNCVDGREGFPHWHANGDTDHVENPMWKSYLPVDENGRVALTLDRAFELAAIHAPALQQQRETLYLSALDVSLQRFGFDTQLFAGYNSFLTAQGRLRNPLLGSRTQLSSSLGVNGGGINLNRLGITGATFAAGLANSLVFNLAGNNTQTASTLFDFSIIQPLLRGAGRDRIMESLTQTERTLLANVRQYERFRRGFYLQIATGRSAGDGPNRTGNFLGLPDAASTQAGGFLGLLQQQQQIRNLEFNLRLLEAVLDQFRTFFEEDRINKLQIRQFEATVFQQQQNLLNTKVTYANTLDQFKRTLGLPPYLDVVIADPMLDRFKIIGDKISNRITDVSGLRMRAGTVINDQVDRINEFKKSIDSQTPSDITQIVDNVQRLKPIIDSALATVQEVRDSDFAEVSGDIDRLAALRDDRIEYLKQLSQDIASGQVDSEVEAQIFAAQSIPEAADIERDLSEKEELLDEIEVDLQLLADQIDDLPSATDDLKDAEIIKLINDNFQMTTPGILTELDGLILELSLLQAKARSNSIEIQKVDIGSEQAFEIARCLRRDWMNARASLVDDWRNIEFVADQLESQIDLVFQGDVGNTGDNPFRIRYRTGQLRAGIRFDAPIVRIAERNDYRAALIDYQQSRRQFYQFEDEVSRNLRQIIRNIDRNKVLFELNRQSIQVNIDAVELSRARLVQPPRPGATSSFSDTTARDLSQAITGLNNVQNQYVQAWVQYEVLRRSLDFDMGTMTLDPLGRWSDPGVIDGSIGIRVANQLGIGLDCRFCDGITTADSINEVIPEFYYDADAQPLEFE